MVFDSLDKAYEYLNTLQINMTDKQDSKMYLTKTELYEKERMMLLKTMPYINEIIQKTSKEIILSFPEDRSHIIDEYNKYIESETENYGTITLSEEDIAYLCSFTFHERDDSYKDKVTVEKKKSINLVKCLHVLQNK
ncbi:hypothetical protein BDAP_002297 [Binucleata daphniae]